LGFLLRVGLIAKTRNPNYLGEVLIYGGLALAAWHWYPVPVLVGWLMFIVRNTRPKASRV
jgi:steroid 5-alpha reductase family enzyme